GTIVKCDATHYGQPRGRVAYERGLVAATTVRLGRQVRTVSLDKQAIQWYARRHGTDGRRAFERHWSGERDEIASVQHAIQKDGVRRAEAVEDARRSVRKCQPGDVGVGLAVV